MKCAKNDCLNVIKNATNDNQRMQKMVKSVFFVLRCAKYFPMQKNG